MSSIAQVTASMDPGKRAMDVTAWLRDVVDTPVGGLSRATTIEEMAALETLKNAIGARQARLAVSFDVAERRAQAAAGVPASRQGRGVAEQIALARRESPTRGASLLAQAKILCVDMPATMMRFVAGELSEYRAGLIATEVALLDAAGRAEVDVALNPAHGRPTDIGAMSNRAVRAAAAQAAYKVDPTVPVRRGKHAESERYVSLRPAPDTMSILSAYLPVRQGVACLAALRAAADAARAAGDPRSRGQIMADCLAARLTGVEHAGALPVELQLIMTDEALRRDADDEAEATPAENGPADAAQTETEHAKSDNVKSENAPPENAPSETAQSENAPFDNAPSENAPSEKSQSENAGSADARPTDVEPDTAATLPGGSDASPTTGATERRCAAGREPAFLVGYGPIPAETARRWLRDTIDAHGKVWIRRLLTDPVSGQVTTIDARARFFPPTMRRLLLARDRYCRTPFCGAPIRHLDHAQDHALGGSTSPDNGQGLCERCNHAKTAPGWSARAVRDPLKLGRHVIETTTPTGHTYASAAPPILTWAEAQPAPESTPGLLPRTG
ncbi:MAG: DUF222 domain-containing protein [Austwickia sp.]|nr:DUF222 domain-containing protein [Austwickia sp.]MCO5308368.1 DUF222 domain-containing protein [Austwickia sp.]